MPRDRQQQQSAADFKKKRAADLRKKKRQARKFKAVATENYDIASSMASAKINIQSMKAAGESVESFARQLARDSNNAAIQNSIDFNTAQKKEALEAARNEASAAGAAALIARQNADNFRADAAGKEIESVTRTAAALQNGVAQTRAEIKKAEASVLDELDKANKEITSMTQQMWAAEQAGNAALVAALKTKIDAAAAAAAAAAAQVGANYSKLQAELNAAFTSMNALMKGLLANIGNSSAALAAARKELTKILRKVLPKPKPGEKTYNIYWCNKHFVFTEKQEDSTVPWKGPDATHYVTGKSTGQTAWPALCHEHHLIQNGSQINTEDQWEAGGFSPIIPLPERHINNLGKAGLAGGSAILLGGGVPFQRTRGEIQSKFNGNNGAYINSIKMVNPPPDGVPMKIYFYSNGWKDIQKALKWADGSPDMEEGAAQHLMNFNPTSKEKEGRDFYPTLDLADKAELTTAEKALMAMNFLILYLIKHTDD